MPRIDSLIKLYHCDNVWQASQPNTPQAPTPKLDVRQPPLFLSIFNHLGFSSRPLIMNSPLIIMEWGVVNIWNGKQKMLCWYSLPTAPATPAAAYGGGGFCFMTSHFQDSITHVVLDIGSRLVSREGMKMKLCLAFAISGLLGYRWWSFSAIIMKVSGKTRSW